MNDINLLPDEIIVKKMRYKDIIIYIFISLVMLLMFCLPKLYLKRYENLLALAKKSLSQSDIEYLNIIDSIDKSKSFINEYEKINKNRKVYCNDIKIISVLKPPNLYINNVYLNKDIKISGEANNIESIFEFCKLLKKNGSYKKVYIISIESINGINKFLIKIEMIGSD